MEYIREVDYDLGLSLFWGGGGGGGGELQFLP